jgi:hypothetical protein
VFPIADSLLPLTHVHQLLTALTALTALAPRLHQLLNTTVHNFVNVTAYVAAVLILPPLHHAGQLLVCKRVVALLMLLPCPPLHHAAGLLVVLSAACHVAYLCLRQLRLLSSQ